MNRFEVFRHFENYKVIKTNLPIPYFFKNYKVKIEDGVLVGFEEVSNENIDL